MKRTFGFYAIAAVLMVLPIVFVSGCVGNDQGPIGGDRDEHGCLIAAGYSWNETMGACIREWELDADQRQAAKTAVDYAGSEYALTVVEANSMDCTGCFNVLLDAEGSRTTIYMAKWAVFDINSISSFEQCVAAGYPVMESYPRKCSTPEGQTFTEILDMNEQLCEMSGGHWNECSSRCQLDNQGNEDIICPAVCEALCECGGIAGFSCPAGYMCRAPSGIADALGYCVVETMTREEAMQIAEESECADQGMLTGDSFYNENTQTWWLEIIPYEDHPGCNPACVVSESTGTAEINWRCTGLIPE